jgi:microcompartment protein CcmL/EutN
MNNTICIIESSSVSVGYKAMDEMVKMSGINIFSSGIRNPGRFLLMAEADEASLKAAYDIGVEICGQWLVDSVILYNIVPEVLRTIDKLNKNVKINTLGIVEVKTMASTILCADVACKSADVEIVKLTISDQMHGAGFFAISGETSDMEAAIEASVRVACEAKVFINSSMFQNPDEKLIAEIMKR